MFPLTMRFYVTRTPDGFYHVQNYVRIYRGQHHVHNKDSFERWKSQDGINQKDIKISDGTCDCGLSESGQVREYDGREWFNDRFE